MKRTPRSVAWAFLLALLPVPLLAQEGSGDADDDGSRTDWFPGEFVVAPLRAAPLEVRLGGGLIVTDRDIDDSIDRGPVLKAAFVIGIG